MKKVFLMLVFIFINYQITSAQFIYPPSGLEAENEGPFYVKVKWDDQSGNEDGFYVERATRLDTADWEVIGGVPQNVRIFNDYWVTHGKKYYYRAYAFNSMSVSDYSNIDYVITAGDTANLPARPTNLRVTGTSITSISVKWDDNANNESGFIIARKKEGQIFFEYIDTVQTDVLTYQDVGLTPDNLYSYKVCAYNEVGISDYSNTVSAVTKESTGIISNNLEFPDKFFVGNNYPNPFNPVTNIKFGIPQKSFVKITIYNSMGREIETLQNGFLSAGNYTISWNAERLSSGVYFYGIKADGFNELKKMILIK